MRYVHAVPPDCACDDKLGFSTSSTKLKGDWLVFLLPLMGLIKFDLIGELFVHELLLILAFPLLVLRRCHLIAKSPARFILLTGVLWFISQVITDLYQDTPVEDLMRGWAKIAFFLVSFASLVMLITTPLRIFLWIAASTVPMFIRPFQLFAHDLDPLVLWKFGVGASFLLLTCMPLIWRVFKASDENASIRYIAYLHIAFGMISFFLNARSFAGLSIITGGLLLLYVKRRGNRIKLQSVALGVLISLMAAIALVGVYSTGASTGFFGEESRAKYELQNAYGGGPIAILLGGRSESMVSTQAIADSPIVGHGSWAKDFKYLFMYVDMRRAFAEEQGNPLDVDMNDGLIPSHSYLLGAWVEAGLLGGLFWVGMLMFCIFRVVPVAFEYSSGASLIAVMTTPMFLWNILFSPFGANVRVEAAGTLAIFVFVVSFAMKYRDATVGARL